VFQRVRQANPSARTVMLTGYRAEMKETVERLRNEGANAVFYKPFDVDRLLTTIEQLSQR
jgi:ActR/RegA family two-component response regulator